MVERQEQLVQLIGKEGGKKHEKKRGGTRGGSGRSTNALWEGRCGKTEYRKERLGAAGSRGSSGKTNQAEGIKSKARKDQGTQPGIGKTNHLTRNPHYQGN